jgi:bifunctional isochorismate lyase/aryl carrier protein
MALPSIASYPMPSEADLPRNKVSWTPDPQRSVLLIHDMQCYFLDAFTRGESPVTELLANIQRLRRHCAALGIPVVYSAQPGGQTPEQRGLLMHFWGPGVSGGPHKKIVDELAPGADDILLTKWRYSAFRKTGLLDLMRERGRDQVLICGIYAHIGCLQTASDAFMHDVQPFLVADALADFSRSHHQMALNYAAQLCAVALTTQRIIEELRPPASQGALSRQQVRADVAEVLLEPSLAIGDDDNLLDRGLDSIRLMSLVERWRSAGAEISFVDLAERPTLADWYALLCPVSQPPPSPVMAAAFSTPSAFPPREYEG